MISTVDAVIIVCIKHVPIHEHIKKSKKISKKSYSYTFSIRTFNASVNLCRELGIRHAEELSLSKPLEQEHLKENYQQTVMRRKPVPPTKEGNTGII